MKSRTYIVIMLTGALLLTVYLFVVTPTTAASQLPLIAGALVAVIPMLAKLGEMEAKTDLAIEKVDSAIIVSKHNAIAIESVAVQVGENTAVTETVKAQAESTHELVNGQSHELRASGKKVAELEAQIAALLGTAAGLETGRQIAVDLLAANAQTPEQRPDGTVVVTAPAIIAVKVPEE